MSIFAPYFDKAHKQLKEETGFNHKDIVNSKQIANDRVEFSAKNLSESITEQYEAKAYVDQFEKAVEDVMSKGRPNDFFQKPRVNLNEDQVRNRLISSI